MILKPEQQSEAILLPFLQAGDDPTSSNAVEELICQFAQPIIGDIIRNKLADSCTTAKIQVYRS